MGGNNLCMCRLCLKEMSVHTCLPIFGHCSIDMCQKILVCSSLKIQRNDGLPVYICKNCNSKLNLCYTFRKQCIISDQILRNALINKISYGMDLKDASSEPVDEQKVKDVNFCGLEERNAEIVEKEESNTIDWSDDSLNIADKIKRSFSVIFAPKKLKINHSRDAIQVDNTIGSENNIKSEEVAEVTSEKNSAMLSKILLKSALPVNESNTQRGKISNSLAIRKRPDKTKKSFACQFCRRIYPSEGGRRYHIHTMHSQNFQPFICDLCGKAFKSKKNLEGHKNSIHFHLKQHLCDLCGRGFASKYALKVHKIWHSGERNFPCDVCAKKFRTKSKLNTHRLVHGGPKNFICEICSRDFRWKKDFEIHLRTHTGEKPYTCPVCGKAFSSLTNKKKHEKSHIQTTSATPSNFLQVEVTLKSENGNFQLPFKTLDE